MFPGFVFFNILVMIPGLDSIYELISHKQLNNIEN
jgi:hypothetical protein